MFLRQVFQVPLCLWRQYWSKTTLQAHQLKSLRKTLSTAYRHVPYYRGKSCYAPERVRSLTDLSTLPIIQKSDLTARNITDFLADNLSPENCVIYHTSGTTGKAITVFHDHFSHDYHTAGGVRRLFATGKYYPTYRTLHIRPLTLPKMFIQRCGLFRRDIIPASLPLEEIKDRIIRERPDILIAFPTYLRELIAISKPEELMKIRANLKAIFTESELLIKEHRKLIESAFQVPAFDDYSAYESLSIAFECSRGRLHIVEDRLILEIVDDSHRSLPDGQEGNIIFTSITAQAMPLIRYSIGDRGIRLREDCPCGRRFATLQLTHGRYDDYILLADGVKIFNLTVLQLAALLENINECFVHQTRDGVVNFYYVPKDGNTKEKNKSIEAEIRLKMKQLAPQEFPFNIIQASAIPRTAGGKGKVIHSEFKRENHR